MAEFDVYKTILDIKSILDILDIKRILDIFGYQEYFKYFVTPSCQYLKTGGLLWRVGFQEDQAVPQVEPVLPGNQTQHFSRMCENDN